MLKNYKMSLLVAASLLAASINMGYAANKAADENELNTASRLAAPTLEDDFKIVDRKTLKQVDYDDLNIVKNVLKTGASAARLSASLTAIYANLQLGWVNLTAFNIPGLIGNVKAIKFAGEDVIETIKQAPAALSKAVLHAASARYHGGKAKDTVFSWFGY